ncbi:MAG: hypothetical protein JEY99_06365 [Spirochaetales bacterium]|nr:hypothetical protein [Spirochaetales bacterium]
MFKRRMKQEQIEEALDEIRKLYDHLIASHGKSPSLKDSFNERYYDAIRMRMDLPGFFRNENDAVKAMEADVLKEQQAKIDKEDSQAKNQVKKKDTAQKVWEENLKRIEKYPDYFFHDDANHDIVKLLGAMRSYESKHWQELAILFRASGTGRQMDTRMALELKWREFCEPAEDGLPSRIIKYRNLLSHYPREPKEVEWEERQILYDAARFLGALSDFIREFLLNERLEISTLEKLKVKKDELDSILADFRLYDLAKLSGRKYL